MKNFIFSLLLFYTGTSYGQSFNGYTAAAFKAEQQENFREALDQYLKAYRLETYNPQLNQKIGLMYFYLYKFDSAIFFYSIALIQNPNDTVSYVQRGSCYLNTDEYQKALDDFTKCSKLVKKVNPAVIFYAGKCDEGLGDWDDAIARFNQVLKVKHADKFSFYEIAYCYTLKFDKANAMKFYNKAIDRDSDYYDAYLNRGLLFESQFNNFARAQQDLEKSIQLKPKNKLSYLYEGELFTDEHQFSNAKDIYDKVLNLYPDFAEAYYERALALNAMGDANGACNDLNEAEKLGYKKATETKKTICK